MQVSMACRDRTVCHNFVLAVTTITLLGRLARSIELRGQGIGEILLVDALKRALQNGAHVTSWATIVDAKDEQAAEFYKHYGFVPFPSKTNRLFLPMSSVHKMFL